MGTPEVTDPEEIRREEEKIFGVDVQNEDSTELISTLEINESKQMGLIGTNCDALEIDTWICDTGASTHNCNTNEGMFDCVTCTNQFFKV